MNQRSDLSDGAAANAEQELARVQGQVEVARATLARVLQDVAAAESRRSNSEAAGLLAANEQLVVAALRSQSDAESAGQTLTEMSRLAVLDSLTQLPNRVLLLDRSARAIALARRNGGRLALLFLDLDNFKQVNDTLGHAIGDEVLKVVALRLAASVREADTVSRIGGDEFLVLLTEMTHPSDAARVVDKVIAKLGAPTHVGQHALRLTASIGISIFPDDGGDAATLIERADAAMYCAKRHGPGSFAFHGKEPAGLHHLEAAPPTSPPWPVTPHELAAGEHERRQAQLRKANEKLVLAALSAQELRAAAQLVQRRQAEFLAVASREMDGPMSALSVAMSLLGRVPADEPGRVWNPSTVEREVENMTLLLDAARAVERACTAMRELDHGPVDMTGIIDAAVDGCRPAMNTRRQRFEALMPAGTINVRGDVAGLAQIVSNLLDNASRSTPEGGQVGLFVVVQDDTVVMTVSDSGGGIIPQGLPEIFEPLDPPALAGRDGIAPDTDPIGVGNAAPDIGLAVVGALVEAHGGTVGARSAGRGRGNQFIVTLPLTADHRS